MKFMGVSFAMPMEIMVEKSLLILIYNYLLIEDLGVRWWRLKHEASEI